MLLIVIAAEKQGRGELQPLTVRFPSLGSGSMYSAAAFNESFGSREIAGFRDDGRTWVVMPGEGPWVITSAILGRAQAGRWKELVRANPEREVDPKTDSFKNLWAGEVLQLPESWWRVVAGPPPAIPVSAAPAAAGDQYLPKAVAVYVPPAEPVVSVADQEKEAAAQAIRTAALVAEQRRVAAEEAAKAAMAAQISAGCSDADGAAAARAAHNAALEAEDAKEAAKWAAAPVSKEAELVVVGDKHGKHVGGDLPYYGTGKLPMPAKSSGGVGWLVGALVVGVGLVALNRRA